MRAKSVLLLMLALGCGLVASIGITQVMAKRGAETSPTGIELAAIFVAMEDIPMGEPITAQMVKLEEWPKDKVPSGSLGKIEDVENRRPKTKIYQGSPVLDNHLLTKGASESGAAGQIPRGYRVVPVRVDDVSGGSSMIRPSDRVDVLLYLQRNPVKEIFETSTRTILQDVRVFAVNAVYDLDSTDNPDKIAARTISLLVTPSQAEKVTLAAEMGEMRLVMRSPEDDTETDTGGSFPDELFGNTEAGDRDKESEAMAPILGVGGSKDNGFIQFLKSQKSKSPSDTGPVPAADNWTMRKIEGSEVSEVVLEMEAGPETQQASPSGSWLWRMIGSSASADSQAAVPDVQLPTTQEEQPASDEDEESEADEKDEE